MKNHFDSLDQVNNLREIQALRRLSPHANVVKLIEVLYDQPTGRLALVFELMDMNIYELIRGRRHYVSDDRLKTYVYQLIKSMDHMHRNGIFHRDIKPENILITDDVLKLADFGSCRGVYSKQPYTEYISTRWYRAPECLLTDGYYNYKMDMWGVGCVFFEMVSLFPLFPGKNELDQIGKIHAIIGTPPSELLQRMKQKSQHMDFNFAPKTGSGIEKLIPHVSNECVDLISKLLAYDPDDRLSARQALRHPYFRDIREAEKRKHAQLRPKNGGLSEAEFAGAAAELKRGDENTSRVNAHTTLDPKGDPHRVVSHQRVSANVAGAAGAPSVASSNTTNTSTTRPRVAAAAGAGAPAVASSKDLPSVSGRAPAAVSGHGGSVASSHHRSNARAYERQYGGGAPSSVSGASVLSAGAISLDGSSLGVGGHSFKSQGAPPAGRVGQGRETGTGREPAIGGMRGGVVGKPYGGRVGGGIGIGGIGGVGGIRAPAAKHREGREARDKYVSPYGQFRR